MAGKKQHIIPQFLQKNFSNNDGIFNHRKNQKSYPVKIKDNWEQNYYYSNLDQPITDIESKKISPLIQELLKKEINMEFQMNTDIRFLITHFWTRNKFIWKIIENEMLTYLNNISIYDQKILRKAALKIYANHRGFFQKNNKTIKDVILTIENFTLPKELQFPEIKKTIQSTSLNFHELSIKPIDNDSNFLSDDFNCIILEFDNLILPDVVAIYFDKTNNQYSPFFDLNTSHIIFPLSKNIFLLIYKELENFKISEINNNLASCAFDSFVIDISDNNPNIKHLKGLIKTSYVYAGIVPQQTENEKVNHIFNALNRYFRENIK